MSKKYKTLEHQRFPSISRKTILEHPGILIDKQMHLRDKSLVAETVESILERHGDNLEDNVVFISNFYGRIQ